MGVASRRPGPRQTRAPSVRPQSSLVLLHAIAEMHHRRRGDGPAILMVTRRASTVLATNSIRPPIEVRKPRDRSRSVPEVPALLLLEESGYIATVARSAGVLPVAGLGHAAAS